MSGVLPDGDPEFPDRVIGRWVCRGWFFGDGAAAQEGPFVVSTQLYDFNPDHPDDAGKIMAVSDGFELADVGKPVQRAVTGGTGPFRNTQGGTVTETRLGVNESGGLNMRFEMRVKLSSGARKLLELLEDDSGA